MDCLFFAAEKKKKKKKKEKKKTGFGQLKMNLYFCQGLLLLHF